jgi:hypothetical protein
MWGSNYNNLYTIKRRYDPNGLFWVTPGVGADDFAVNHGRLCHVAAVPQQSPYFSTANPNGEAPASDNNNIVYEETNAFQTMPETQAQADAETPKLGKWS